MFSIDNLVGMVLSEPIEEEVPDYRATNESPATDDSLKIQYDLELIRMPDGRLKWVE